MFTLLKKFERAVVVSLIAMLAMVVALSAVELGWILVKDVLSEPMFFLEIDELLEIFGFFLLVLIGIELLETIKNYLEKGHIELRVIFTVALIAIGRKIIILNPEDYDGLTLSGIGVIIFALVIGYGVAADKFTRR